MYSIWIHNTGVIKLPLWAGKGWAGEEEGAEGGVCPDELSLVGGHGVQQAVHVVQHPVLPLTVLLVLV